jgi:hypothetical protein
VPAKQARVAEFKPQYYPTPPQNSLKLTNGRKDLLHWKLSYIAGRSANEFLKTQKTSIMH